MKDSPNSTTASDATSSSSGFYNWYVIIVLMLCYTLATIDNSLPSILVEAIKADLKLSDTQIGLITGPAFALTYAIAAIPIAKISDRRSRTKVISVAIVVWSAFTAIGGLVHSFASLALSRVGVAIGEAALTPAAHSIIADRTTPGKRPIAMAIYSLGAVVGAGGALALGGYISDNYGWRASLVSVGVSGMILALLVLVTVKDPNRRADTDKFELPKGNLKSLFANAAIRNTILGATLALFSGGALNNWGPAYIMRTFNLSATEVGASFGGLLGVLGISGLLIGGFVASWFATRRPGLTFKLLAVLMVISTVVQVASFLVTSYIAFLVLTGIAILCVGFYFAPTYSTIQSLVDPSARSFASAVTMFCIGALGMALGTFLAGVLSDLLAPTLGVESLRWAILILTLSRLWGAVHYYLAGKAIDKLHAS